MSDTYFTSDTHFGHENIVEFCNRPFGSVFAMDEGLIANWNARVRDGDTVYHLGDFCWGNAQLWKRFRERLNGNICFIRGNHDKQVNQKLFQWVKDYAEIMVDGQRIILFHYPMRSWNHSGRGAWHLFGHCHGKMPQLGKSIDVGVDPWYMTLVSMNQLHNKLDDAEEFL
jgi:calcineurin-like phosphoesterase family protein